MLNAFAAATSSRCTFALTNTHGVKFTCECQPNATLAHSILFNFFFSFGSVFKKSFDFLFIIWYLLRFFSVYHFELKSKFELSMYGICCWPNRIVDVALIENLLWTVSISTHTHTNVYKIWIFFFNFHLRLYAICIVYI